MLRERIQHNLGRSEHDAGIWVTVSYPYQSQMDESESRKDLGTCDSSNSYSRDGRLLCVT